MTTERLRKIIAFSREKHNDINSYVRKFYDLAGIQYESELLNYLQIVRSGLLKLGYLFFEIPFSDIEIGAFCYKGDGKGYIVANSALPRANMNFAIAHEIYHVYFQKLQFISKVDFAAEDYNSDQEEWSANLFAGALLMPETGFRRMFLKFKAESENNGSDTIVRLMSYYQVPYMAVLIRSIELGLMGGMEVSQEILAVKRDDIAKRLHELWLDESILVPSLTDDFSRVEAMVDSYGKNYVNDGLINERTLTKVLQNMRTLYGKIKGE